MRGRSGAGGPPPLSADADDLTAAGEERAVAHVRNDAVAPRMRPRDRARVRGQAARDPVGSGAHDRHPATVHAPLELDLDRGTDGANDTGEAGRAAVAVEMEADPHERALADHGTRQRGEPPTVTTRTIVFTLRLARVKETWPEALVSLALPTCRKPPV